MAWHEAYGITKSFYSDECVCIVHGDFREVLPQLPDGSINLVLTDPPYTREYDWVWPILGNESSRVLIPGGSLITLCGHYHMPMVISELTKYLEWYWCCQIPNRRKPMQYGWHISVSWKPALWLTKGKAIIKHWPISDNLAAAGKASNLWQGNKTHPWGQSEEMAIQPILRIISNMDIVLDPFLGSGTTAWVAKKLGRKCIGIEIDERYAHMAADRCRQGVLFVTDNDRRCYTCGNILSSKRSDSRYCSGRCRQIAYRKRCSQIAACGKSIHT